MMVRWETVEGKTETHYISNDVANKSSSRMFICYYNIYIHTSKWYCWNVQAESTSIRPASQYCIWPCTFVLQIPTSTRSLPLCFPSSVVYDYLLYFFQLNTQFVHQVDRFFLLSYECVTLRVYHVQFECFIWHVRLLGATSIILMLLCTCVCVHMHMRICLFW